MKRARGALACLLLAPLAAQAVETLITESFEVRIESRCPEGLVTCDDVGYVGIHRKSGKSIALRGRTLHRTCSDGVTPCRFLGYEFRNGTTIYRVWESGLLEVVRGNKAILSQPGVWQ